MATAREYRQCEKILSKYTLREVLDELALQGNVYDMDIYFAHIDSFDDLRQVIFNYLHMTDEDFQYAYLARSGNKKLSRLAIMMAVGPGGYDDPDGTIPLDGVEWVKSLIKHVHQRYGASLLATAQAYFDSDYNPINNYDMTETETPNITETTSGSSNSKVESESHASSSLYGFNSTDPVPATKSDADTTTEALKANNYTDGSRTTTGTRTLTRSGNIGVTTSQQMLESELELRKFDLLERVFQCFDKVFVRSVYAR